MLEFVSNPKIISSTLTQHCVSSVVRLSSDFKRKERKRKCSGVSFFSAVTGRCPVDRRLRFKNMTCASANSGLYPRITHTSTYTHTHAH